MKRKLKKRKGNDRMELIEMQAHEERKCNDSRETIEMQTNNILTNVEV